MDPHLVHVPRLGALAAGCLARRDFESFGRQADRALDAQVLGLGALEELGADFFQGLDLAAGEGDADFVDFLNMMLMMHYGRGLRGSTYRAITHVLLWLLERHLVCGIEINREGVGDIDLIKGRHRSRPELKSSVM